MTTFSIRLFPVCHLRIGTRRCPIWRTFVLQKGNSYVSAVDWVILAMFGVLIDIDLLKKVTSPNPKPEVKLRHSGRHLKMDKTSYDRREWSDIDEMWNADAEWHDNYGDGWKTKNCLLVVLVCKSGMLFRRKIVRLRFSPKLHNCIFILLNCGTGILYAQLARRFYSYAAEITCSVCLKL